MDGNRRPEYAFLMALVRILVDGYNLIHAIEQHRKIKGNPLSGLLHNWPARSVGTLRHFEAARDALVEMLQQYQDACGTPVTIFLTGRRAAQQAQKRVGQGGGNPFFQRRPDGG